MNRQSLLKEEVQMAKKHMKKCPPTLATKEMQVKITLRFHITLLEWLPSSTQRKTNVGEDTAVQRNPRTLLVGM
jgi:hypothetical protein